MFLVAEGSHDGYFPGVHRRVIVYGAESGWLVLDDIRQPEAPADADVYWHFSPEWQVHRQDATTLSAVNSSGGRAWMVHEEATTHLHCGGDRAGWYSPRYGALLPACSAQLRVGAATSRQFATVIGDDRIATPRRVTSKMRDTGAVMVRVGDERGTILTLLQPGTMRRPRLADADGVATDARMLQLRTAGSRCSVSIAEATRVSGAALPFAIEADEPFHDLHISIEDGVARYWSRSPAPSIRLTWRAGAALQIVPQDGRRSPGTEFIETAVGA
jgi:hypothetical protein